jgi:thioredoxin-like negative regulator of GroEL
MTQVGGRWRLAFFLAGAVAAILLWGRWRWSEVRYNRQAMAQIEEEIDKGHHSLAAKHLVGFLARNPGSDEAAFLLGNCEKARGRAQAAVEAWAKVPPSSTFAFRAIEQRVAAEVEDGRLTEAEQFIAGVHASRQFSRSDLDMLLGPIYCRVGRNDDAMKLIEAQWWWHYKSGTAASEIAIDQLRGYIQIRLDPLPVETIGSFLDHAGRIAPNDDRIWLWRARLAIRTQAYEDAARLLDRCLELRPEDAGVWRVRLEWAVATNRVAVAREALKHLPAAESTSPQIEKLAAWFAARRGDDEAERNSLHRLIAADPNDVAALDRLIELQVRSAQPDLAALLRRRKDEIERLQDRYQTLFKRRQPRRDAEEMGRLAEQLGHLFEAKAFLTIAVADAPGRADIRRDLERLMNSTETRVTPARSMAELLASQLNNHQKKSGQLPRETNKP